ncbi:MAG: DUF523 and DUF1722 domain-containing protein [Desulfurivibrionaceae bacterium]|nr:DUF523 and DUF1722 domain-containing protein [Desulfurivibrionaceae bacterium]
MNPEHSPIKIGISACLLGEKVRYDGGHKHDRLITDFLGRFLEFTPVCPEVECGLGTPREAMHLVGNPDEPRLVTIKTGIDHTRRLQEWAIQKVRDLEKEGLHGFIFKSKSPSSGMERVKVYGEGRTVYHNGVGMFARAFMEHFPLLPVEEDGRLHDSALRENFIEAIFASRRWRELRAGPKRLGRLVDFHTDHKLQVMAHSVSHYRELGKLVARGKELPIDDLLDSYEKLLMEALRLKPTVKKHVNVLQHMAGYFKKQLAAAEKQELQEIIEQYHRELVPLIVPVTLINHYVRKYRVDYLARQHYLSPHPIELKLRNHA